MTIKNADILPAMVPIKKLLNGVSKNPPLPRSGPPLSLFYAWSLLNTLSSLLLLINPS